MPNSVVFVITTLAFIVGLAVGSVKESSTDFGYKEMLATLDSYNDFCELNGFGELKSYDRHTFTCNSGKEIPIDLLLGRD